MTSIEIPMFLYKYRTDSDFTKRIITERKVWLATSSELNDPFECLMELQAAEWANEELLDHTKDVTDAWTFFRRIPEIPAVSGVKNIVRSPMELFQDVGVFSLSEDVLNADLWAKYGDDGRGLALGFMTHPESILFSSSHVIRVDYSDGPVGITNQEFQARTNTKLQADGLAVTRTMLSLDDPTVRKVIGTKSTVWEGEKEWRYVELEGGLYEWPGPLLRIVFGWATPKETIDEYLDIASKNIPHPCQVFRVELAPANKELIMNHWMDLL